MSVAFARAVRRLHPAHLRLLSTSVEAPSESQSQHRETRRKRWQPAENLRRLHPRMVFVRPWDGVPSMVHAFAIIREIERRFGKVQEFVVLRDSDVWTNNLPYMLATFARAEYTDAIPLEGRVIQVPIPTVDPDREGGVGLDDLEVYLDSTAWAQRRSGDTEHGIAREEEGKESGVGTEAGKVMDVKLERTGMRESLPPVDFLIGRGRSRRAPFSRSPGHMREFADSIVSFGGFAPAVRELVDSKDSKTLMESVMEKWSQKEVKTNSSASETVPSSTEHAEPEPEPEPVPWTPFTEKDDPPGSDAPLHPSAPISAESAPSTSELPPLPTTPIPSSAVDDSSNPQAIPEPTPTRPIVPKMSKKQRMLLAARAAGANTVNQPAENDFGSLKGPSDPAVDDVLTKSDSGADSEDVANRDSENKQAAKKWWNFLTRGG